MVIRQIFSILLFTCIGTNLHGQEQCEPKYAYCTNTKDFYYFAPTNQAPASILADYGCMTTQDNPMYFTMQITQTGSLAIVIQGTIMNAQLPGYDVDFVCWGPFSTVYPDCDSLTSNHIIDCGYSASSSETLNIPSAVAGEFYVFMISNTSNLSQAIMLNKIGGNSGANGGCVPPNSGITCSGNMTYINIENTDSLSNPTYSILPGGQVSNQPYFPVAPLVTTTYTTYVSGVNSQSILTTNTAVVTITVSAGPVFNLSIIQSKCTNTANFVDLGLSFIPTGSSPSYSISWIPQPSSVFSNNQTFASNLDPGDYGIFIISQDTSVNFYCGLYFKFVIDSLPKPPSFTLTPTANYFTVNCARPTFTIEGDNPALHYQWNKTGSSPLSGQNVTFGNLHAGTWTVTGTDTITECLSTRTIHISLDFVAPSSTIVPLTQLISCSNTAVQTVTVFPNPSINIEHQFFWSNGLSILGMYANTAIVSPPPGTHTYVLVNRVNGCKSTKTFSVATTSGFPTFSLSSPVQNYSIGCAPKNFADVNIIGGNTDPPGGALAYTIIPPGYSGIYSTGPASAHLFSVAGVYTVIAKDNVSNCESKSPFSIIQNTVLPETNVSMLSNTLTCFHPSIMLTGATNVADFEFQWKYLNGEGVQPGANFLVQINSNPLNILIETYTFVVKDLNNACTEQSVVPMYQNIFPPIPKISPPNGSTAAISCKQPTLILTNSSTSGIPFGTFPLGGLVIAESWEGPGLQPKVNNSSTYVAEEPGTYSLVVRDMNNGCMASTVFPVADNRDYPVINNPITPPIAFLDCGESIATVSAYITNANPVKYVWYTNLGPFNSATLSNGTGTVTAEVDKLGIYQIQVIDEENGCMSWSNAQVVKGELDARFLVSDTSGFAPFTTTLTNISSSSLGTPDITSIWTFGNGNSQTVSPNANPGINVQSTYDQPGTYTINLFTTKGECTDQEQRLIFVELPSKLLIPNAFSPNGDGVNDVFYLHAASLIHIQVSIFDRWGNLVFKGESIVGNVEWDAKNLYGQDVSEGTYLIIVNAIGKDGKNYDSKSTLSIFR